MAKTAKRTSKKEGTGNSVNEPQAVYARKAPGRAAARRQKGKGYDAKRSSGMLPGIAERMKEYLKTMRDDR